MPTIRLRLTGDRDKASTLIDYLQSLEGIERVEEVDDLMGNMPVDSSSNELPDDQGPGLHRIEVQAPNDEIADRVREAAEAKAFQLEAGIEFVERF